MASAYDEIKKVLAMLRHGEPITEQNRVELNRVRKLLEHEVAAAELLRDDLPAGIVESRGAVAKNSLAARKSPAP
jgi:hypothetical protein